MIIRMKFGYTSEIELDMKSNIPFRVITNLVQKILKDGKKKEKRAEEEAQRIPFRTLVLQKMEELDLDAQTLYKRAGIDRKLFSKLKTDLDYRPNKNTAIRYCLGFRLNEAETDEWMKSAGFWLSDTSAFDLAIRYCIDRKIYDPIDVNILLEALKIPLLK